MPPLGVQYWEDWCLTYDAHNIPRFYMLGWHCPPFTMCADLNTPSQNGVDTRETWTVVCIPISLHRTEIVNDPAGNVDQIGVANVVGPVPSGPQNGERTVSIVVQNSISRRSVSALLQGTY
jgi:hypothetical protein